VIYAKPYPVEIKSGTIDRGQQPVSVRGLQEDSKKVVTWFQRCGDHEGHLYV